MSSAASASVLPTAIVEDRRAIVLRAALQTFARFGYRKTSMDQIAHDAAISRPGLYFLFGSKQALFREAVEQCLRTDLADIESVLTNSGGSLRDRLLRAFDVWAGRYVGPLARDIGTLVEDNPDLHGPMARAAPASFAALILTAITTGSARQHENGRAEQIAQTLISTSIGIKYQVDERDQYRQRLGVALDLLLPSHAGPHGTPELAQPC